MEMFLCCVLFALGILFVVKGGDAFVDGASWIAKALRVPTFIIGATIVSIATTLPEMIVSVIASAEGKNDMAVGNAVGSVTANIGLIMAVAMICMTVVCERRKYIFQCLMLMASAAVLCVSCIGGKLNIAGGILLALIFVSFMYQNVRSARADMAKNNETKETEKPERKEIIKNILFFILGAVAIVVGSRLMVDNGSEIALKLGVPERVIAVTLVAVGTSLPELVTTITAIIKKEASLSIGNIIGANIIDLSLILPICSLVSGQALPVSKTCYTLDIPVCLGFVLISMLPLLIKQKAYKAQGFAMLALYVVYIVATVII
jgi:cation:H+ antiporter